MIKNFKEVKYSSYYLNLNLNITLDNLLEIFPPKGMV